MLFVTQAMGDDSDGRAQITDDSARQAKAVDVLNGLTHINGDAAEQAEVPEDSDRQEQVTIDSTGQAQSTGDIVEPTVTSANHSPCSGVDNSLKLHVRSCTPESHDVAPMDISPSASPLIESTTVLTEHESVTSTDTAMSTTGETGEVCDSVKPAGFENGMLMPRALKPVKYLHADDPRRTQSSVLSLLKRCKSCAKKMARAKRKGVPYTPVECTCARETFVSNKFECEKNAGAAEAETGLEKLEPPPASATSTGVRRQHHVISDGDEPMGNSEPPEPSLASAKLKRSFDCDSVPAAMLAEETQPLSAFCAEKKSGSEDLNTYSIPVIEGFRPTRDSWHRQRTASIDSCIVLDSGPNNGEVFSGYSPDHISAEYLVNRFIEEIRAASEQKLCARDPRVTVKISGAYVPGPMVDNLQTTVIDVKMDPLLGACVEHAEGPFLLPSELEEDDEGWLWTFE
ncbi:hypothetical protein HPB52_020357 [Rhipicephalus sanguineus]|uniref:Uncharacterized protein n=1 Tax=Rhipicephalus sanguineus TaxID=34632 RepID=A0A9D4PPB1_RHISA|nr:hypothetical protein HPB52_020357 [Rhipicephalus sanguineus]